MKKFFGLVFYFSGAVLLIHLYTNIFASYGIFRDEFYYIACSNNLAFGYVDHPPFSIFVLAFIKSIFGNSLFAIRMLPAILHSATVFIVGFSTYKLGGNKIAMLISMIAFVSAPIYWGFSTYYSMNSIDFFLWSLSYFILILFIKSNNKNYIYILFLIIGIGLLNKISFLWFGFGLVISFLLSDFRKLIISKEFLIGFVISFLIFFPFLIWNFQNDFAHFEFMQNAVKYKYSGITRADFLSGVILILNPLTFPIWLTGIIAFFFNKDLKKFRILGIIFLTTFFILLINGKSKSEYLAASFIILFSSGGVFLENLLRSKFVKISAIAYSFLILISLIIILPMAIPILPVEKFISYSKNLGIEQQNSESKELAELPQFYADMFGWESLAKDVSEVYKRLSSNEKTNAIVFAQNYGEAGALEYYSEKYKLPTIVSSHNNYWLWGFDKIKNKETVIVISDNKESLEELFEKVELTAVHKCKYCMPYENNLPIFICKGLKKPLSAIWKEIKNYN